MLDAESGLKRNGQTPRTRRVLSPDQVEAGNEDSGGGGEYGFVQGKDVYFVLRDEIKVWDLFCLNEFEFRLMRQMRRVDFGLGCAAMLIDVWCGNGEQ